MVRKWDEWAKAYNAYIAGCTGNKAMIYIPRAVTWRMTELLTPNAISNTCLSLGLAYLVLLGATMNWIISTLAVLNVGMIVTMIFGCMYAFGW